LLQLGEDTTSSLQNFCLQTQHVRIPSTISHNHLAPMVAVGVNIAIEKILSLVFAFEQQQGRDKGTKLKTSEVEVFVCSVGRNMLEDRMQIANDLWAVELKVCIRVAK
jgi:histidyl-tRNA synthetase